MQLVHRHTAVRKAILATQACVQGKEGPIHEETCSDEEPTVRYDHTF